MLFLRIALIITVFSFEARAERLQVQVLDTATLSHAIAAGVKYDIGQGDESLTSNRYADLDYPRQREIRFSRSQNDVFPRTIRLLENVEQTKGCGPRTVYVARQGMEFSPRAFNQSLEYLTSASCAERDKALVWYRAASFQIDDVVKTLERVNPGGFNKLIIEARYLNALDSACVLLGYESECVAALAVAARLRNDLIANAGKDRIDPNLADKVAWNARETMFKAKSRTASALFVARKYQDAASKYREIIQDCSADKKFCAAITLTETFLVDQLALSLAKAGEQLTRTDKAASCTAYSDAHTQFALSAKLKGDADTKTNRERDFIGNMMGTACVSTTGGMS